uniref:Uncharacterized protein n=1 Tax=Arundo donax TaxID=35708 RepID=A0A0A9AW49_ARUDO
MQFATSHAYYTMTTASEPCNVLFKETICMLNHIRTIKLT